MRDFSNTVSRLLQVICWAFVRETWETEILFYSTSQYEIRQIIWARRYVFLCGLSGEDLRQEWAIPPAEGPAPTPFTLHRMITTGLGLIVSGQIDWVTRRDSKSLWELGCGPCAGSRRRAEWQRRSESLWNGRHKGGWNHIWLFGAEAGARAHARLLPKQSAKTDWFSFPVFTRSQVFAFTELRQIFPEEDKWISSPVINFLYSPWKDVRP